MRQLKEGHRELFVVNDKFGTPTYTHDFARNVKVLLNKEYWGLYNMVCGGVTDRLEVVKELVSLLGMSDQIKITEVSSEHFKHEYFALRPPSERLFNQKLSIRGLDVMRHWKISLKEYLDKDYNGYLSN
jgi:dTDP-4-dehydrorhamnose reductase